MPESNERPLSQAQALLEEIKRYEETMEFTSHFTMNVNLARYRLLETSWREQLGADLVAVYHKHYDLLLAAGRELEPLNEEGRKLEIALWFGRPELATHIEAARSQTASRWHDETYKMPCGPQALKKVYETGDKNRYSASDETYTAMIWGSAGRVMMTINPLKKDWPFFSWVFDESADHPRGGMQGCGGTKEQIMKLIRFGHTLDGSMFKYNENVTYCGV